MGSKPEKTSMEKKCVCIGYQTKKCVALSLSLSLSLCSGYRSKPSFKNAQTEQDPRLQNMGNCCTPLQREENSTVKVCQSNELRRQNKPSGHGGWEMPSHIDIPGPSWIFFQTRSHWMCLFSSPSPTGWQLGRCGTALVESHGYAPDLDKHHGLIHTQNHYLKSLDINDICLFHKQVFSGYLSYKISPVSSRSRGTFHWNQLLGVWDPAWPDNVEEIHQLNLRQISQETSIITTVMED